MEEIRFGDSKLRDRFRKSIFVLFLVVAVGCRANKFKVLIDTRMRIELFL